ncbi:MAG TPA: porin [Halomonas sp.]|nr:porin [Halomonas sp.]
MKYVLSKLALVTAIAVASTAQAEDFEVSDKTTVSLFGAIELKYNTADEISDTDGATESTSGYEDNGSSIGFGAQHDFDNGMSGYIEIEFEHDANESGGEVLTDKAFAGLIGNFGEVRAGRFDSIYTNALYDLIDPFETVSLGEESVMEEDNQIAYYSPDFSGFTFELQARVRGDRETDSEGNETGMAGVVKYTADRWAVHAGVDDRGAEEVRDPITGEWTTEDPVYGLGGVMSLTDQLDLGARVSVQENLEGSADGDDTTFYGTSLIYDYGPGSAYGAVQQVDPDQGDSRTEFAAGINYGVVENLTVYTEYGSYDAADDAVGDIDTQFEVGAIYEF